MLGCMDAAKLEQAHHRLIREFRRDALDTANWTGRKEFSDATMKAMAAVKRHLFVLPEHEVAA